MHACTIIARNYLPYARVLAESFAENHPDERFTALVLDGDDRLDEPFEVLSPFDIGIAPDEVHRMAMIYDLKELATAVKPWLLRTLLEGGADVATYFDPDIEIYKPLHDIEALAREHSIVLTPHVTEPLPDDGLLPDERMIMNAGIYNLGFISVGTEAHEFLDWWSNKLARNCIVAIDQALFVDQRWIDFVPSLFRHYIFTDRGCNVAYWNLHYRTIKRRGDDYEVDGVPLRFFHFSGYKPDKPYVLSVHTGEKSRILLSKNPDLARLCEAYGRRVMARGFEDLKKDAYVYDRLPGGLEVDAALRRFYRKELMSSEREGRAKPPDPFDPAADRFMEWINGPPDEAPETSISRYLYAYYRRRADLREAFPDVLGNDSSRYVDWILKDGVIEADFPKELLPRRPRKRMPNASGPARKRTSGGKSGRASSLVDAVENPEAGVNLVGYLGAELGVGEVARKLMAGLDRAGIEFSTVNYKRTLSRQEHPADERLAQQAPFDMNVICVNADQLPIFRRDAGSAFFEGRYSVGVWFWEVSTFPREFHEAFELVNEVWVGSAFVREALAKATSKPIHVVPLPLEMTKPIQITREQLGLPEGFMFLFSFDFLSVFERKNPLGLIEAFGRAFADGEGPILVVKSINGERDLESLERLRLAAAARSDIHLLEGYLSHEMKDALSAACDCYVSLHRSEGFGLTMAEAMALGKPVIATGYSGNADFMDAGNSYVIPYELVKIPEGCDLYPAGAEWADPDLDDAAAAMRRVFEDPDAARELGERAREDILERFSVDRTAAFLAERFESRTPEVSSKVNINDVLEDMRDKLDRRPADDLIRAKRWRPGVRSVRALMRRLLWPYFNSQRELDVAIGEAIAGSRRDLDRLGVGVSSLEEAVRHLESSLGSLESSLGRLGSDISLSLNDARSRLERLEVELTAQPYVADPESLRTVDDSGRPAIGFRDADPGAGGDYRAFEDAFRGPEELIRERQRPYLELIDGRSPVLDAGCGRGEFLELLAEARVDAVGIDIDSGMVARCREKGLAAEEADANSYLRSQPDGSLGVVFSAQLIEHLPYEELLEFFRLAEQKLMPSGLFIAETVNPHSIQAFKAFWTDLTHRVPIFPEVAVTLARLSGFESAYVLFPLGSGDLEVDRRTQGEYALVATRAPKGPA